MTGIYYRGDDATYKNTLVADNGSSIFFSNNQALVGSTVIGLSSNYSTSDLNYLNYLKSNVRFPLDENINGALLYDEPLTLENVHFANFSDIDLIFFNGELDDENSHPEEFYSDFKYTPTAIKLNGAAANYTNISSRLTFSPQPKRKVDLRLDGNSRLFPLGG